ncbi:MAG: 50S ribosomal protein L23 [Candidatus Harrisonbacteria bacterium]|nr:50S ribosomal protein L23 [Candidatus Harrisonbacteria bacterium]MBI2604128.1 50S ribosomal protein L23 [Candidatus Harrisonbacteria bacterium]
MENATTKQSNKFILRPVISEKSTDFAALGKYMFAVLPGITQSEVKKAVEQRYGVHVVKTNVITQKAKPKYFRRSIRLVARPKKVVVTLKKGEKLDILAQ